MQVDRQDIGSLHHQLHRHQGVHGQAHNEAALTHRHDRLRKHRHRVLLDQMGGQDNLSRDELFPVLIHAAFTIGLCFLFPVVSLALVDPYIGTVYNRVVDMDREITS